MDFNLTERQRELLDPFQALCAQSIEPGAERVDRERAFPRENIARLAEAGYLGLLVPEEFAALPVPGMSCVKPRSPSSAPRPEPQPRQPGPNGQRCGLGHGGDRPGIVVEVLDLPVGQGPLVDLHGVQGPGEPVGRAPFASPKVSVETG